MSERFYTYRGDGFTDPKLRGHRCKAVLRDDGKCITGRSLMLVSFTEGDRAGEHVTVLRRQLRKCTMQQLFKTDIRFDDLVLKPDWAFTKALMEYEHPRFGRVKQFTAMQSLEHRQSHIFTLTVMLKTQRVGLYCTMDMPVLQLKNGDVTEVYLSRIEELVNDAWAERCFANGGPSWFREENGQWVYCAGEHPSFPGRALKPLGRIHELAHGIQQWGYPPARQHGVESSIAKAKAEIERCHREHTIDDETVVSGYE